MEVNRDVTPPTTAVYTLSPGQVASNRDQAQVPRLQAAPDGFSPAGADGAGVPKVWSNNKLQQPNPTPVAAPSQTDNKAPTRTGESTKR
uniref:Uncharacterized protein n=1 Tax=Knipowitschia caucasica TaxID=637954 RepID=A0AAV2MNR3_KNICA